MSLFVHSPSLLRVPSEDTEVPFYAVGQVRVCRDIVGRIIIIVNLVRTGAEHALPVDRGAGSEVRCWGE